MFYQNIYLQSDERVKLNLFYFTISNINRHIMYLPVFSFSRWVYFVYRYKIIYHNKIAYMKL